MGIKLVYAFIRFLFHSSKTILRAFVTHSDPSLDFFSAALRCHSLFKSLLPHAPHSRLLICTVMSQSITEQQVKPTWSGSLLLSFVPFPVMPSPLASLRRAVLIREISPINWPSSWEHKRQQLRMTTCVCTCMQNGVSKGYTSNSLLYTCTHLCLQIPCL